MSEPKTMTFNDLEQWLNERRVTEVECLVPDLTGVARGKILPRAKFTEDRGMRLPQAIDLGFQLGDFPRRRMLELLRNLLEFVVVVTDLIEDLGFGAWHVVR